MWQRWVHWIRLLGWIDRGKQSSEIQYTKNFSSWKRWFFRILYIWFDSLYPPTKESFLLNEPRDAKFSKRQAREILKGVDRLSKENLSKIVKDLSPYQITTWWFWWFYRYPSKIHLRFRRITPRKSSLCIRRYIKYFDNNIF